MSHYRYKEIRGKSGYGVVYDPEASSIAARGLEKDQYTDDELFERLAKAGERMVAMQKEITELRIRVRDAERDAREARAQLARVLG